MNDSPLDYQRGELTVSTDRRRLDLDRALALLETTSWAADMPREVLARAVENSLCFGVYDRERLVGLARVVTDLATFAYLTDVVIDPTERGRGLGQWLVQCILDHPGLQGLRRIALLTSDAQELYARFGFRSDTGAITYMELPGTRA